MRTSLIYISPVNHLFIFEYNAMNVNVIPGRKLHLNKLQDVKIFRVKLEIKIKTKTNANKNCMNNYINSFNVKY